MNKLTHEQQQLILDFYFRCGEPEDIERGRDLIASNHEAAVLYASLEQSLTELDHIKYEPCPDNLVDLTIARLKLAASCANASNSRLNDLLEQQALYKPERASQQTQKWNRNFLRPAFEILAAAASIVLAAGLLFPSFGAMRHYAQKNACAYNLRQIGAGFASLASISQDELAQARVPAGSPWWKIGDQGPQTQSNTRYPYQLVKQGLVSSSAFVCKGSAGARPLENDPAILSRLYDFPSRSHVSYSFILWCDKTSDPFVGGRRIIAGDLNPVFRKIPFQQDIYRQRDEFEQVLLNEELKKMLSENHCCRGQNILYSDGSIEYLKSRLINGDDIFTVLGVDAYRGREVPASDRDAFLAP